MSTYSTQAARVHSQPIRSYRKDGRWFFQLSGDTIWGPFDRVIEAVMADRQFAERELDEREVARLMLEFA